MNRTLLHLPLLVFLGGVLACGGSFAWYVLTSFDYVNLVLDANIDDAFYYFQIARNFAEGKFSTFDGGITRTNGYHPVWMLLITPFYWMFDPETALFGIKAFEIMLIAGGVALIVLAARLARLPWILLFAVLPTLYGNHALMSGMEAAAALFFLGTLFLAAILFARNPDRWQWPLTLAVFTLPWVRLEYVAISLAVTGTLYLIEIEAEYPKRIRSRALAPLLGACAGIMAYFAYNGLVFGGIVPVSGAVKLELSQRMWEREGGYVFVESLRGVMNRLQFAVGLEELLVALETGVYVVLVWAFGRRSRSREDRLLLVFLICVFGLGLEHLAKIAHTVLALHPSIAYHSQWHYVPAYLMTALIVPVRFYVVIYVVRRFMKWEGFAWQASRTCILVVAAIFMFTQTEFVQPYRSVDRKSRSPDVDSFKWYFSAYRGAQVMNRILPEGSIIGSWDSGIVGYLSRFPVVNLDGLVNSYDYMRRNHKADGFGITHFANDLGVDRNPDDWRIDRNHDNMLFEGKSFTTDEERRFKIWSRAPFWSSEVEIDPVHPVASRFWLRMEPHFDHRFDDMGVMIDGRVVQIFAEDCAPDRAHDGSLVFSWAGAERGYVHPLADVRKNRMGLCVDAVLLPRDAVPPIEVTSARQGDTAGQVPGGFEDGIGNRRPDDGRREHGIARIRKVPNGGMNMGIMDEG